MADEKLTYADGTEIDTDVVDASTARSQIGMDPATGAGNGDPASDDPNTAANAPTASKR